MFALGLYFETHEYLEGYWRKESGARRVALQGLIQVAAAFHKLERSPGSRSGAAELLEKGLEKLARGGAALGPGTAAGLRARLLPALAALKAGRAPAAPRLRWARVA